jgi:transposase InsO family protein
MYRWQYEADMPWTSSRGSPRINGKFVILTVVDRFSKFAHFILLGHPYTTTLVARAFFTDIIRLHSLSSSIVSDRDLVFTRKFWQELLSLAGVKLNLSSAFHPQSDGQSKAVNKVIMMYLRCLTGD